LGEIDPNFGRERDDPALQEAQAERARVFSEKARTGQATVQELITACAKFRRRFRPPRRRWERLVTRR